MAILLRVCSFVFFIWFVMLPTHGTSQDPATLQAFAFKEPTHLLISGENATAGLKFAPIGSYDQFQEIPGLDSSVIDNPQSVAFDPVEQRAYWADKDLEAIFRCKLDGTQVERIVDNIQSLNGLALDPVNRLMYFSANDTTIQSSNLDGTGSEILVNNGTETWAVAIDITRSRVYWSDYDTSTINRVNIDGSGYMIVINEGLYYPYALTVDEKGARLYWSDSDYSDVESSDLDGNNVTTAVYVSDKGYHYGIVFYQDHGQDQIIAASDKVGNVAVWNLTSEMTDVYNQQAPWLQEPPVFLNLWGLCLFYKYESPPPILGIKLIQVVAKRGMIIARINVPIKVDMAGWTLVINFPRQVFDLKIFGCDVEIQDKSQTKLGGLRLGTKYTIIPSPGSDIPSLGSRLRFKMEAKTWQNKKQPRFQRGIFADFYPTPLV